MSKAACVAALIGGMLGVAAANVGASSDAATECDSRTEPDTHSSEQPGDRRRESETKAGNRAAERRANASDPRDTSTDRAAAESKGFACQVFSNGGEAP